jgi:hypothetical protein
MVEAGLKAKDGYAVFGAVYGVGEREVMRRILTAALQERVSEDAVRVAVEGALCYDCGCESEGPWKCERVIAALSAGRGA